MFWREMECSGVRSLQGEILRIIVDEHGQAAGLT